MTDPDAFPFAATGFAKCKGCGDKCPLNVDSRCVMCADLFIRKVRGLNFIPVPWGLRHVREQGWAEK